MRLIRHVLIITQAEVSRLGEPWATWTAPYVIPLHDAWKLAQDAAMGRVVADVPDYALDRLARRTRLTLER